MCCETNANTDTLIGRLRALEMMETTEGQSGTEEEEGQERPHDIGNTCGGKRHCQQHMDLVLETQQQGGFAVIQESSVVHQQAESTVTELDSDDRVRGWMHRVRKMKIFICHMLCAADHFQNSWKVSCCHVTFLFIGSNERSHLHLSNTVSLFFCVECFWNKNMFQACARQPVVKHCNCSTSRPKTWKTITSLTNEVQVGSLCCYC